MRHYRAFKGILNAFSKVFQRSYESWQGDVAYSGDAHVADAHRSVPQDITGVDFTRDDVKKDDEVIDLESRPPRTEPCIIHSIWDEVQLHCRRCNSKTFEVVYFSGEHVPRFVCRCGLKWPYKRSMSA